MKTIKLIIILLLLVLVLTSCHKTDSESVVIDGKSTGYSFMSDTARMDDAVFFNYDGHFYDMGIYKINSAGTKLIKKEEGANFLNEAAIDLNKLLVFKNKLLFEESCIGLYEIDTETGQTHTYLSYTNYFHDRYIRCIGTFNKKILLLSYFDDKLEKIYEYNGKELKEVYKFKESVAHTCFLKDKFYFLKSDNNRLYRYIYKNKKTEYVTTIKDRKINNFIVDEYSKKIVVCQYKGKSEDRVYKLNTISFNKDDQTVVISDSNCEMTFDLPPVIKCINGNLYIGGYEEFYIYSLNSKKTTAILKLDVNEICIFDDKYIYLNCPKLSYDSKNVSSLYRITQDNKTIEKVFG